MIRTDAAALCGLWRDLGIGQGEIVLCHSHLPSLGLLQPGPGAVVESLLEALGSSGTLVAPTFTYSWFRGEPYDARRSPGTVGLLGELVRTHPRAVRSLDPCFSNAAIGRDAAELLRRDTPASFGANSFYDKLLRRGGRILLIGVDFTALPLFMHLERINAVPYRYEKRFTGELIVDGRRQASELIHFVRDEKIDPQTDRSRISAALDARPECRRVRFAYGEHRAMPAAAVAAEVARRLAAEPNFLLKDPEAQPG